MGVYFQSLEEKHWKRWLDIVKVEKNERRNWKPFYNGSLTFYMAMDHFNLHGDEGQGEKTVLYIIESIIWNNILGDDLPLS